MLHPILQQLATEFPILRIVATWTNVYIVGKPVEIQRKHSTVSSNFPAVLGLKAAAINARYLGRAARKSPPR